MKNINTFRLIALLLISIGCTQFVSAQDSLEAATKKADDSWKYTVTPYIWLSSIEGNLTVADQDIPVDLNFAKDLLSKLKMGAMVHAEAKKNKLSLMLDIFYAKLGTDENVAGALGNIRDVRLRLKQTMFEGGLGYTFAQTGGFSLDALAGARFFNVTTNVQIDDIEIANTKFNFLDPYVGMRFHNDWNKWAIGGRVDIGGFGLGSEYSYKINGLIHYKFKESLVASIGYQVYKPKYQEDMFEYNLGTEGFLLGLTFNF
ncbi:MAG: hypothetical protein QNK20_13810 [Aureibaculum sp.]|nr:hypothetical protein [Aureibaculum sp.]